MTRRLLIAAAVALSIATIRLQAHAGERCGKCGRDACVEKVCHVICETKKIDKVTYTCECEDFCVPGKSERGCPKASSGCEECKKSWFSHNTLYDWVPGCATVHTRKKVLKKVEPVE